MLMSTSVLFTETPTVPDDIPSSSSQKPKPKRRAKAKAEAPAGTEGEDKQKKVVPPEQVFLKKISKELKNLEAVRDKLKTISEAAALEAAMSGFCDQLISVKSDLEIFIENEASDAEVPNHMFIYSFSKSDTCEDVKAQQHKCTRITSQVKSVMDRGNALVSDAEFQRKVKLSRSVARAATVPTAKEADVKDGEPVEVLCKFVLIVALVGHCVDTPLQFTYACSRWNRVHKGSEKWLPCSARTVETGAYASSKQLILWSASDAIGSIGNQIGYIFPLYKAGAWQCLRTV